MDTGTMWFCLFSDVALDDLQLMNGADAMLAGGQETVYVPTGESTVTAEATSPQAGTSTGPARGFQTINIEHMAATTLAYVMSQKSKSTLRKQKIVVGRFYEWLRSNNEMQKLEELSIGRIDQLLAFWLMDLKSVDGSDYEVGTLTSYLSSIKAYLKGLGHDVEKLDITKQVTTAKKKNWNLWAKGTSRIGQVALVQRRRTGYGTLGHLVVRIRKVCCMGCGICLRKVLGSGVDTRLGNCASETWSKSATVKEEVSSSGMNV